ncbi:MAG: hypothetical protein IJH76_01665 [Clostridia bacterium]|nr:hypothetical protein [Clostridia bacterium]
MKFLKTEEKTEKISKEIDKKSNKKVFINLLIAILIMAYFCVLSVAYKQWVHENIVDVMKVTTMVFLAISLILIEIAYKKESKVMAIHAFEILALSIHSLTTMHVTKINNFDFNNYILISSYGFSIYYVLKTIFIATRSRKEFLNGLSDISEIVEKEEPKKKEASKKDKKKGYTLIDDISKNNEETINESNIDEDDGNYIIENDDLDEVEEELDVITVEETKQEKEDQELDNQEDNNVEDKSISNDKLAKLREKLKRLQEIDSRLDKSVKNKEELNNKEIKDETKNKENKIEEIENKSIESSEKKAKKRGRPKKVSTDTEASAKATNKNEANATIVENAQENRKQ